MDQLDMFSAIGEEIEQAPALQVATRPGEIWQLGRHRLLVGDCTDQAGLDRLFAGQQAKLVFTSPPYADQRDYDGQPFPWTETMNRAFDQWILHGTKDVQILVNLGMSHKNRRVNYYWNDWLDYCEGIGWPLFGQYVWDKGPGMPGDHNGRLATTYDFIFHFCQQPKYPNKWIKTKNDPQQTERNREKAYREPDGRRRPPRGASQYGQPYKIPDNVVRINRELTRGIHTENHPATCPQALPEFIYKTWTQPGDLVFEPFCGSGTSIIAAEATGRTCYATERVPHYCDVAITRWQIATGRKAIEP